MEVSTVVNTVLAVTIGIVLIGSLLYPQLTATIAKMQTDHADWAALLGLVMIATIIGLVVVALHALQNGSK